MTTPLNDAIFLPNAVELPKVKLKVRGGCQMHREIHDVDLTVMSKAVLTRKKEIDLPNSARLLVYTVGTTFTIACCNYTYGVKLHRNFQTSP